LVQCPEPQSLSLPQFAPSPQVGEQAGGWQTPAMQRAEPQSVLSPHGVPPLQLGEQPGA
jgi:hypothetical protein